MNAHRVIVCLDVKDGRVVKGTQFENLKDSGDPVELAVRYEEEGADEICFLDISASHEGRKTLWEVVERTAARVFIPLAVGGGIATQADVATGLRAGADKLSFNSAALARPQCIAEAAASVGSQCVVVSIDAKREGDVFRVYSHGGRTATDKEAVAWAQQCVALGAGEILLTSIDRDGARSGYDLELTRAVAEAVTVPVIASGGAGSPEHVTQVFLTTSANAALLAGILHDRSYRVDDIKRAMNAVNISVRNSEGYVAKPS